MIDHDLEDERDDDGDDEVEPEPAASPVAAKVGKKAGKTPNILRGGNRGAAAPQTTFRNKEAEALWGEILEHIARENRTPYDVSIQVVRVDPPPAPTPIGLSFDGGAVSGSDNVSPSDALLSYVVQHYHLATTDRPARYILKFMWKANSQQIAQGYINLPSRADCLNAMNGAQQAMQGAAAPPRFQPAPWPQQQQPQPQYAQQQQPQSWPQPQATQPAPSADMSSMLGELSYLRGALGEALSAAREGRQPNIPSPPGVSAPPAPAFNEDAIVDRIAAKVLLAMGRGPMAAPPPPVAVAPAAPPPAPTPSVTSLEGMAQEMMGSMLKTAFRAVAANVERGMASTLGLGAPSAEETDEPEPPAAPIVPAVDPQDAVPWTVSDVGSNWGNGQPVKIAIDKETGNISPMGLAFANPAVAERAMDIANGIGSALQDWIKNTAAGVGAPNRPKSHPAQVVREIPANAVDANGSPPNPSTPDWQAT